MPRQSRVIIPGIPHHISQRGNYQMPVFEQFDDFMRYCSWYNKYAAKYRVATYAYCFMTNHVHFIAQPVNSDGLARLFNALHMRYAQHINKRRKVLGHLWQGRFYSCALGEEHLYRAIRYVERNPVRAKMVRDAAEYEWSSAGEHTGKGKRVIRLSDSFEMNPKEWREYLTDGDREMEEEMRIKTKKGLVIGTEKFIKEMEQKLKRRLTSLMPGRPRKQD